jgi:hypothetical protein
LSQLAQPPQTASHSAAKPFHPPPKPVLTLRVGVTGHRDLKQADLPSLHRAVDDVLRLVERVVREVAKTPDTGYDEKAPPVLVAVSPLADGADRLFASTARSRGWKLHVPMPFAQAEYEKDFKTPASLREFHDLLSYAARKLELDGSREHEERAYLRAGQITLHQCDVLVAVWDGESAVRIGGTAQVTEEAYARGIPIVWVRSAPPHAATLLTAPPSEKEEGVNLQPRLAQRLREMLLPPALLGDDPQPETRMERLRRRLGGPASRLDAEAYYQPRFSGGVRLPVFRWFRNVVLLGTCADAGEESERPAHPDYVWADHRANAHANAYRNAFTLSYLLGAFAVFFALLAIIVEWAVVVELLLTGLAILVGGTAWVSRWHAHWLDERLLAERFRQLDILQELGYSAPGARASSVPFAARPNELWVTWLFRAHARTVPLPQESFNDTYLNRYRARLLDVLESQKEYHEVAHHNLHHLRERLHYLGLALFVATLVICVVHLVVHPEGETKNWLTVAAGALPAFAAAFAGIIGHGEFQRLARNAHETAARLELLMEQLPPAHDSDETAAPPWLPMEQIKPAKGGTSREYAAIAERAADLMLSELLAWHLLINERPIEVGAH